MKFFTLTHEGRLTPGLRVADLSSGGTILGMPSGILLLENDKRRILPRDRKAGPMLCNDGRGTDWIKDADFGTFYPEQSCAPGQTARMCEMLFAVKDPKVVTGGIVIAIPLRNLDKPPEVTNLMFSRDRTKSWVSHGPRTTQCAPVGSGEQFTDPGSPAHLLYVLYGITLRFHWSAEEDWVVDAPETRKSVPATWTFKTWQREQHRNTPLDHPLT